MLRCSEYTCRPSTSFDHTADLSFTDISISQDRRIASINIKASKTDPFKLGVVVRVGCTVNQFCSVQALISYMGVHSRSRGPFFVLTNGDHLTRRHITSLLRAAVTSSNINTHSFRIGGASAAATAGIANSLFQILGRWSSDAYRRYIHLSDEFVVDTSQRLSSSNVISRLWDTDLASSYNV